MKFLLIFWGCMACGLSMQAQLAENQRDFRSGYLDSLRTIESLQYGEDPGENPPTRITQLPEEPAPRESASDGVTLVLLILILAVIVFAGIMVLRQFSGKNNRIENIPIPIIEQEEAFRSTGFQSLIGQAESDQDWRNAFRYRYLALLQQLEKKGILDWHPHKTDETYVREIQDSMLRSQFLPVAQAYAWIWYGQRAISEARYHQLLPLFHPFSTSRQR